MVRCVKMSLSVLSALFIGWTALASDDGLSMAVSLYEDGLYARALDVLHSLPGAGDDPLIDGYAVLCAQKMKLDGYQGRVQAYLDEYPSGILKNEILREYAYDLFDRKEYASAMKIFCSYPYSDVPAREKSAFTFKRGYCLYRDGQNGEAMRAFDAVTRMEMGDYTAPAFYCAAYILYNQGDFYRAIEYFEKASADERLRHISDYYSVICLYQLKDYEKVLERGLPLFNSRDVDPQRRHFLARMISESYLVGGDGARARQFYSESGEEGLRSRADYFYAGSLMFATKDWRAAVENYSHVTPVRDSLAQIAWYNTALADISLKNKVGALDAFRNAALLPFDATMGEDAFFNWAKLAFDINRDTSVFAKYLKKYSDKVRGELIFSYMALAALSDRDWQAAIDNFDRIEELSDKDRNNYVHANYLRGCQLLDNGSYRSCMPYFQTVDYYTPKDDRLSQLSRYNLAVASYRNSQFKDASAIFVALYNSSALYGMPQNVNLAYNAACSYLKQEDFATAQKWFTTYYGQEDAPYRKEAMTLAADCCFADGRYKEAVTAYTEEINRFYDVNDIYPYWRLSIAKGLAKDKKGKLASLKRVLDASPSAPYYSEAMLELAKAYQENRQSDDAARTCRKLIAESPDTVFKARGLLELGTLKRNAGFPDAAVECYRTVIEQMPSSGLVEDALLAMESLYRSQKKPAKYIAYLESIGRGAQISPEDRQEMIFAAAEQQFYSGDFAGAAASFTEFEKTFPDSPRVPHADYYIARSYEQAADKVKASDIYGKLLDGDGALSAEWQKDALRRYAAISFDLENYKRASGAYSRIIDGEFSEQDRLQARIGLMRSLFCMREYEKTAALARELSSCTLAVDTGREVKMTLADCLVSLSRRDEALPVLEELAREPGTAEGARASVMLAQHSYDKADYEDVIRRVHAFASSGTPKEYWLARAFIILGDAYCDMGNPKQAAATYQSIIDGYSNKTDGVVSDVRGRLEKMEDPSL